MTATSSTLIINQAADAVTEYLQIEKPLGEGATKEMAVTALRKLVEQYKGSNVSHIFWNTVYQRATYESEAWATYWDIDDPDSVLKCFPKGYYEFKKLGITDAFEILIPHSRANGISPWVSIRMNDVHFTEDENRMNPYWNEHPELRLHTKPGFDNGWNYTLPEVRAHYMKIVRESFFRWDVDGVEMDWMRFINLFPKGQEEAGRESLTLFMREARAIADEAAIKHGHDVGIAVRVPATPEFAYGLGLDVETWIKEGLVDMVIPGSHWQPSFPDTPISDWKAIIPAGNNVQIVPGTDLWMGGMPGGAVAGTGMGPMRGFTASMLDKGADGIYLFNHFEPAKSKINKFTEEFGQDLDSTMYDLMCVAGDLNKSAAGPRRHVQTFHAPVPESANYTSPLPADIDANNSATLELHTGPKITTGTAILRIGLDKNEGFETAILMALVNGQACDALPDMPTPPETEPRRFGWYGYVGAYAPRMMELSIPLSALKDGYNTIEISTADSAQRIVWAEVSLDSAAT